MPAGAAFSQERAEVISVFRPAALPQHAEVCHGVFSYSSALDRVLAVFLNQFTFVRWESLPYSGKEEILKYTEPSSDT